MEVPAINGGGLMAEAARSRCDIGVVDCCDLPRLLTFDDNDTDPAVYSAAILAADEANMFLGGATKGAGPRFRSRLLSSPIIIVTSAAAAAVVCCGGGAGTTG